MKIHPVEADLFHANGRAGRYYKANLFTEHYLLTVKLLILDSKILSHVIF